MPAPVEPPVVFEDDCLLVVDKPAGLVVHPARGHQEGTLVQLLADRVGGGDQPERPGVVHRLDKNTSGLLVLAKTDAAHRALAKAIADRAVTREYLALVEGRPSAQSGAIDAPIGRGRGDRTKISIDTDRPREARTHFKTEQTFPTTTLLRVTLETGRTHQIRAHFKAIGHPVVGDPEYGTAGMCGLDRQFLHATRLVFIHPLSGESLEFESPLPAELVSALGQLA